MTAIPILIQPLNLRERPPFVKVLALEPTHKCVVGPFVFPPFGGFPRCYLFQNRLKARLQNRFTRLLC